MKRQQKLYSCGQAAPLTGYTRDWLQKLCRRGKLGTRVSIRGTDACRYLISEKEIQAISSAKTQGKRQSCKSSE